MRSARNSEPNLSPADVVALVSQSSGVPAPLIDAAVAYWADYGAEIDALIARAEVEEERGRQRWEREHGLLAQ